jgi:hypothetical protein
MSYVEAEGATIMNRNAQLMARIMFAVAWCSLAPLPVANAQFTNIGADLIGVRAARVAWGDYDNDGALDLALMGFEASGPVARVYRNHGEGVFMNIGAGLDSVYDGSLAWGDYDNNGRLDLALMGSSGASTRASKIYHNDGEDVFSDIHAGLTERSAGSLAWGDYDNDGDLDLVLAGLGGGGQFVSRVYENDGEDVFTNMGAAGLADVWICSLAWGDYDNDGDLDLALAGLSLSGAVTAIYSNNGEGVFTAIGAGLTPEMRCELAWGDYDNDGDLDLGIAGNFSKIYRNEGNGVFTDIGAGLPRLETDSRRNTFAWGDYDNDGDLDVAIAGESRDGPFVSRVYQNNGDETFEPIPAGLPGVNDGCCVAWGDYDNDGDLDLAIAGFDTMNEYICRIYNNDGTLFNTVPAAPDDLSASVAGNGVTLSWAAASDGETPTKGLSYNVRVGTSPNSDDVMCAMADLSTGFRRIPALGNAQQNLSWPLYDLPEGIYYWSVQAVDTAFAGSLWAPTAQFVISDTAPIVASIVRADPSPTSAASVDYAVTFSTEVTGVDVNDFTLTVTGVAGAHVTAVSGSGSSYTVTVDTGSGDGTIRLDVTDDDSIVDGLSNPLGGTGLGNGDFTSGEQYTIDRTYPRARIKIPGEGKRIAGNRVTVMAELLCDEIEDIEGIRFQYRLLPSETWLDIPAANINHPNPDTTHPYFVHWDVTGLPSPSTCELRAVATTVGHVTDPDPEIRTVIIDHGAPDHSEEVNVDGDQELHSSLLAAEQNDLGSADPRSNIVVALIIPPDALPADTGGTILFLPAEDYLPTLGEYDSDCNAYVELALDAGDLTGGMKAVVKVHYPDADQDGFIDGTTLSELGLVLCSYETDTWVPLENSTVDPEANTVQGLTTHLSSFGAVGLDDDGDGLGNEFEETVSSTSRTDSDSDADGVTDYAEVGYDGDADNYDPYDPDTNPSGTDLDANDPDTDGDSMSDGDEITFGYDPTDPNSWAEVPLFPMVGYFLLAALLSGAGFLAVRGFKRRET